MIKKQYKLIKWAKSKKKCHPTPVPVPDFFRVLMYDHNYSLQLASQLGQQIQLIFKLICLYQIIIRSLKIFFSEMKF